MSTNPTVRLMRRARRFAESFKKEPNTWDAYGLTQIVTHLRRDGVSVDVFTWNRYVEAIRFQGSAECAA